MSVDTHLCIGTRWSLEDIKKVLERTQNTKVEINYTHTPEMQRWEFKVGKNDRSMFVHIQYQTPIGQATMLSLGHNQQAIKIMRNIAVVLGGYLEESDCDSTGEMIHGRMDENDGLPYFVKFAILEEGISHDDLEALTASIKKWEERIGGNKS
jgi:hypothetical protein